MKKILALVLAVIMAFGCMTVAFAGNVMTCPYCGGKFTDSDIYNEHIAICYDQQNKSDVNLGNLSLSDTLNNLIEMFDIGTGWWDAIEDVIIRMIDFFENIGTAILEKVDAAAA